ncbi:CCA tRNA nucleotidyltransferase [Cereibacter azotoformans]|uniref:Poly(A) polymerase n=2 Tax=Cereibacter azotoformans TaxID=43057 RepID=A0A2T5K8E5_9RHOB|nr:CCA tRNA nucleotidyltransferase [Cereibacter azotoformans]AXQ94963.1 CCA tRNA nucleotidyltransferase [Cereibacter sphaeroides]MBO4170155.1 CCA tRNA nucleotidyltransferase [Cereibacter azotoformans]PTR18612.1 poly(A) polymerase [Cereibacter azotoformans]UIJ30549.1 CCA tRNA nucleotidyltransferase [Cereibacter azotoformans]
MRIEGDWIAEPATQTLCAALAAAGHRALFVGGCVRNALLGRPVADIDLATDAVPDTVSAVAAAAGFKVVPTGIEHGTVTVIASGIPHEVTTFRRDIETFGRHAVVAFSTDVAEDAARRDFTMNALYAEATGEVIDPLGGLPDLIARRVRFVGDPIQRIEEDYLRILRFFRFHAIYGDPSEGLDAEGLAACAARAEGLCQLSRERVGAEMRKLLAADDPAPAVAAMEAAGVLVRVLPGASARALPVLVHLEEDRPAGWLVRLASLGGEEVADRLRLSRADGAALGRLRAAALEGAPPAEQGYRLGLDLGAGAVLLHAALSEAPPPEGWRADVARGAGARFPVKAADLMPALAGPALGARLRELEERWIASDFRLDRAALLG